MFVDIRYIKQKIDNEYYPIQSLDEGITSNIHILVEQSLCDYLKNLCAVYTKETAYTVFESQKSKAIDIVLHNFFIKTA
jgi:hypothetical protein